MSKIKNIYLYKRTCQTKQKFISLKEHHVRSTIRGIDSLFVKSESNICCLIELIEALITEFGTQINSAECHKILSRLHMREKGTIFEYCLIMNEMRSCANIQNSTLFRFFINNIPDSPQIKCLLYDFTNLHEKNKSYNFMKKLDLT